MGCGSSERSVGWASSFQVCNHTSYASSAAVTQAVQMFPTRSIMQLVDSNEAYNAKPKTSLNAGIVCRNSTWGVKGVSNELELGLVRYMLGSSSTTPADIPPNPSSAAPESHRRTNTPCYFELRDRLYRRMMLPQ